ncbi:hypothetical protein [Nocardia rhamnosiphila]
MNPEKSTDFPILPVPSDLYTELGELSDQLRQVQRTVRAVEARYLELGGHLDALDVDTLGESTTPDQEVDRCLEALEETRFAFDRAGRWLDAAHVHSSRLKLTDQAAEDRERRVAAQWPQFTGSGPAHTEQATANQERVLAHRRSSGRERSR